MRGSGAANTAVVPGKRQRRPGTTAVGVADALAYPTIS